MKKLLEGEQCIEDQINDSAEHELESTVNWLEGWICGFTDSYHKTEFDNYRKGKLFDYIQHRLKLRKLAKSHNSDNVTKGVRL